jgi:tetratricopeptide (TPR) repeat protein
MNSNPPKVVQERTASRHFLFSRADVRRLAKEAQPVSQALAAALQSEFPHVLQGKNFRQAVLHRVADAPAFAAMVLRPDRTKQAADETGTGQAPELISLAGALDSWCRNQEALWGFIQDGLLACVLIGKSGSQGLTLAQDFQASQSGQLQESFSIGVAAYPLITYEKQQTIDNACKALDHAAFLGPNQAVLCDAVSLNICGDRLIEKGKTAEAIAEFKRALILDPANINLRNSLGVCYGLQGEFDNALIELHTAVSLDPTEIMAVYNLGLIYALKGDRIKALEFFLQAGSLNNRVFEVQFQTGKLYLEMGEPQPAKNYLEQASQLEAEAAPVHRYLGECYAAMGRTADAISAYKKAVQRNPADAASLSALGCLFDAKAESPDIAMMFCQESVKLAPQNGLFRYRLGQLHLKQNRRADALREFKKAHLLGYDADQAIADLENQTKTDVECN